MSLIIAGLLGAAKIAGGIIAARTVGQGISAIGERIFPYDKTRAYKQTAQNLSGQKELERMREEFQRKLQEESIAANLELERRREEFQREQQRENIQANKEIAVFNQIFQRQTHMLLAEFNTYNSLRHTLLQDAIRNFPLNISPLVLLENNNIDISFLLGNKASASDSLSESMMKNLSATKPINVFITPMHIDARVGGKELMAAQVYDSVYSSLESVVVNEYSRNSERPVIFYSTAWNKNTKGGLHAAEEIFYFLKDMPTIVVEPRFDGKCVKIFFSCWGIGYSKGLHCRQEIQIPLDLNSMLAIYAYERSTKALETVSKIDNPSKPIQDQISMYKHNIKIFEDLNLTTRIEVRLKEIASEGHSDELSELGDFSKLMYISQDDVTGLSNIISATLGMMISSISDTHHLLANDVSPRFPYIYKKYFGEYINNDLLKVFSRTYEQAYLKLSKEFPDDEARRLVQKEKIMLLLQQPISSNGKKESDDLYFALKKWCVNLGLKQADTSIELPNLINYYVEHYDGDEDFANNLIPFMTDDQRRKLQITMTDNI